MNVSTDEVRSIARVADADAALAAEQSLLGAMLCDPAAVDAAANAVAARDFSDASYGAVFAAALALRREGEAVDPITVAERVGSVSLQDLTALVAAVPSIKNAATYARAVADRARRRRLASALLRASREAEMPDSDLNAIVSDLSDVLTPRAGESARHWADVVRTYRRAEALATRRPGIDWAVEGWIQAGQVGVLVAGGGTGKTTLLLVLGVCIALGWEFFGAPVKRGSFLLLSNDDRQDDLDDALALICRAYRLSDEQIALVEEKVRVVSLIGLAGERAFTSATRGDILPTDMPELLDRATRDIPDLVGVALDTLRQFCGGSSNDEQVIKLTLDGCRVFAQRRGAFVVLPHHTGKQNYREQVTDLYAGSGSAAIADNSRFVLLLQSVQWSEINDKIERTGNETGDALVLRSTRGSLLVRPPEPMYLSRSDWYLTRIRGRVLTVAQQLDALDRKVLQAVRDGAQSKTRVLAKIGGKRNRVFALVDKLVERGLLVLGDRTGSRGGSLPLMVSAAGAKLLDTPETPVPFTGSPLRTGTGEPVPPD